MPKAAIQPTYLELVPKDSFPTLSSIFVEALCRSFVEHGLFRQSSPTKFSTKFLRCPVLGQALPTDDALSSCWCWWERGLQPASGSGWEKRPGIRCPRG